MSKVVIDRDHLLENEKWAVRWLTGRMHVGIPDRDVYAEFRARARKAGASPRLARLNARYAVEMHREDRGLYARVMSGRL